MVASRTLPLRLSTVRFRLNISQEMAVVDAAAAEAARHPAPAVKPAASRVDTGPTQAEGVRGKPNADQTGVGDGLVSSFNFFRPIATSYIS